MVSSSAEVWSGHRDIQTQDALTIRSQISLTQLTRHYDELDIRNPELGIRFHCYCQPNLTHTTRGLSPPSVGTCPAHTVEFSSRAALVTDILHDAQTGRQVRCNDSLRLSKNPRLSVPLTTHDVPFARLRSLSQTACRAGTTRTKSRYPNISLRS